MTEISIGLALSGGGAAGLGHIPVLQALGDLGLRPAAIAGTSIGALMGVAYAAGLTGDQLLEHVLGLADDPVRTARRFWSHRRSLVGNVSFQIDAVAAASTVLPSAVPDTLDDLQIPITVATTDFHARRAAYFSSGPLLGPVAGSMAIPGVFRPVAFEGRLLIDGGVTDNLPLAGLSECDLCLAVDVASDPNGLSEMEPDTTTLVVESLNIMMGQMLEARLKKRPDAVRLLPTSNGTKALEFHKTTEILKQAEPTRAKARAAIEAALSALRP